MLRRGLSRSPQKMPLFRNSAKIRVGRSTETQTLNATIGTLAAETPCPFDIAAIFLCGRRWGSGADQCARRVSDDASSTDRATT